MANGILLEAGTNEMELLIFRLGGTAFGINVAKVREVVQRPHTIPIPHAPQQVEGSFRLREEVLTLVNLGRHFQMEPRRDEGDEGMIIIVEFNKLRCGVLVDKVEVIHRLRWDEIDAPSSYLRNHNVPVTGVARVGEQIILIVDFETIVGDILGVESATDLGEERPKCTQDIRLLAADDSSVLRIKLRKVLESCGFTNITICCDGQETWDYLNAHRHDDGGPCDLVLTDIEMPRMDGLHLTARIKNDPDFVALPVILFSSLITPDNIRKGESVGADAQVSKPDSEAVIGAIFECLEKAGKLSPEPALS